MEEEILWHDRKRKMGLPLSFTRYYLQKDKLIHSEGFLFVREGEFMLYRVMDVEIKYSLIDRILGVGTIVLYGADLSDNRFVISRVKNPRRVLNQINSLVEKERLKLGIKGKELFGAMSGTQN
jgi:uncharacterized membrane protein YdbT with pleckstrin-like domain